jgi:hypothetical protein
MPDLTDGPARMPGHMRTETMNAELRRKTDDLCTRLTQLRDSL